MSARRCVVLGAGGHARVVLASLDRVAVDVVGALVAPGDATHDDIGVPVLGGDELLRQLRETGVTHFVIGIGGTRDNWPRAKAFEAGVAAGLSPLTVVHPTAVCLALEGLGGGVFLGPGAIVNIGSKVGDNVIVNSGAIVEHDCHLGAHVHVASGAVLGGGVRADSYAHIGAGAVVRQGLSIGSAAIVAAGAVVVEDVDPGVTVAGVPAKPLERS